MSPPKIYPCTFRILGFGDHVRIRASPRTILKKASSHAFCGVRLGWRVGVSQRPCGETHRSRMFAVWCLLRACRRWLATRGLAPVLAHRDVRCVSLRASRCFLMCVKFLFRSELVRDRPDQDPACKFTDMLACWQACDLACL